jgi:hypothetical protein
MDPQVLGGTPDGVRLVHVDGEWSCPVGLQPAQDLLALLGRGCRCRPGTWDDGVGSGAQLVDPGAGGRAGRDDPGCRQSAVPDHVHRPPAVLAPGGDELRAAGERPQSLGAGRPAQERAEAVPPRARVLEPAGCREHLHPAGHRGDDVVGPLVQRPSRRATTLS